MAGDMEFAQSAEAPVRHLEKRRGKTFLLAGGLLLISTIFNGIDLASAATFRGPETYLTEFIGPIVAYLGLIGLFRDLATKLRRVALGSLLLLIFPTMATVLGFVFYITRVESLFIVDVLILVYVGFALGFTLFAAASLYTGVPSRGVGVGLLVYALPWFGIAILRGITPVLVDFIAFGIMAVALLSVGFQLQGLPQSYRTA